MKARRKIIVYIATSADGYIASRRRYRMAKSSAAHSRLRHERVLPDH
jgi:hypothetical protein